MVQFHKTSSQDICTRLWLTRSFFVPRATTFSKVSINTLSQMCLLLSIPLFQTTANLANPLKWESTHLLKDQLLAINAQSARMLKSLIVTFGTMSRSRIIVSWLTPLSVIMLSLRKVLSFNQALWYLLESMSKRGSQFKREQWPVDSLLTLNPWSSKRLRSTQTITSILEWSPFFLENVCSLMESI